MFCFRMAAALATVALVLACSDESESSPNGGQQGNTSDFICQGAVIPVPSHVHPHDAHLGMAGGQPPCKIRMD